MLADEFSFCTPPNGMHNFSVKPVWTCFMWLRDCSCLWSDGQLHNEDLVLPPILPWLTALSLSLTALRLPLQENISILSSPQVLFDKEPGLSFISLRAPPKENLRSGSCCHFQYHHLWSPYAHLLVIKQSYSQVSKLPTFSTESYIYICSFLCLESALPPAPSGELPTMPWVKSDNGQSSTSQNFTTINENV